LVTDPVGRREGPQQWHGPHRITGPKGTDAGSGSLWLCQGTRRAYPAGKG
jgi:hypothetical protein